MSCPECGSEMTDPAEPCGRCGAPAVVLEGVRPGPASGQALPATSLAGEPLALPPSAGQVWTSARLAVSREWVAFKDAAGGAPWTVIPYAAVSALSPAPGGRIRISQPDGRSVVLDEQVLAAPGASALLAEGLYGNADVALAARRLLQPYLEEAAGRRTGLEPGPGGGAARPPRRMRRRFLSIAAGGAVLAAAVAVPLALARPGAHRAGHPATPAAAPSHSGTQPATLTNPSSAAVDAVAFGPGGVLAAGDNDGSTYLWNTATGHLTATRTDPAAQA